MPLPEEVIEFKLRTKIVYRDGAVEELAYELEEVGAKKLAIFTDKGVIDAGILDYVQKNLEDADVEVVGIFDKIQQDALASIINEAAVWLKEVGADSILAVGGGSVMDTAKGANVLFTSEDEEDIAEHVGAEIVGVPMLPHVAIPTTSGTGCEVTWGAVVKNEADQTKTGFIEFYCVADTALLDPQVTKSMPPRLTASTGMDALTHAIEGYTSPGANPLTDAMNLHAIRLIAKWLPEATHNGDDLDARSYMAFAACVAGVGFFNSMTGGVHACAHALGGIHSVPHGMANTVMLPAIMDFNKEYIAEQLRDVAEAMGAGVKDMSPEEGADAAVVAVTKLIEDIGLPSDLKEWGITEDDLPALAEKAMEDSQMPFNPRPCDEEEILEVYRSVL